MSYIVKSSLDIGGKIIPWNEQEAEKLIKEKEEILKKEETSVSETEKPKQEKQEDLKKTETKAKKGKE